MLSFIERQHFLSASAFLRVLGASVIDEDLPHHPSCDAQEMDAVTNVGSRLASKLGVHLMNQSGRLKCVARSLTPQVLLGDPAQLPVHQWQQTTQGIFIALGVLMHQHCYCVRWSRHCHYPKLVRKERLSSGAA